MKYKVIKNFPNGPRVGAIMENMGTWAYEEGKMASTFRFTTVESYPEYFAPFKCMTEQNEEIFYGDNLWYIDTQSGDYKIIKHYWVLVFPSGLHYKYFSTKEAAQQYIDSKRKPIWKTEDGFDVFDEDNVKWVISNSDGVWYFAYNTTLNADNLVYPQNQPDVYKVFKDEDKMNTWITQMNTPKFQKGDWIYVQGQSGWVSLLKFDSYNIPDNDYFSTSENYVIYFEGSIQCKGFQNGWSVTSSCAKYSLATEEQIESILSKVALHKGFKTGIKFMSVMSNTLYTISEWATFKYHNINDALLEGWGNCVYKNGVWANIVEEVTPKAEYLINLTQDKNDASLEVDVKGYITSVDVKSSSSIKINYTIV